MISVKVLAVLITCFTLSNQLTKTCNEWINSKYDKLIVDYAEWRKINYLVILDEVMEIGCKVQFLKRNMKDLSTRNIYVSFILSVSCIKETLNLKTKILVVTHDKNINESQDFLQKANQIIQYGGNNVGWLLITNQYDISLLETAEFSLDADIVVALPTNNLNKEKSTEPRENFTADNNTSFITEECDDILKETSTETFNSSKASISICLFQIYKIRKSIPRSLVIRPLGLWNKNQKMKTKQEFLDVEGRLDFMQFPLIAGTRNSTETMKEDGTIVEDEDYDNLDEFYNYFSNFLNSSTHIKTYPSIGSMDLNGEWTDLIGAIIKEEIDIGLDKIVVTIDRNEYISFTQDISTYMRNIYVLPEESDEVKNIFMAPFNSTLIAYVLATCLTFACALTINNKIVAICFDSEYQNYGFLDSLIWCVGIFANQGSTMKPRYCAEYIIILVSLLFTIVIYNAYSAFITSILSVKLANIKTVDDLLKSDYEIGYAKNSEDEIYLRTTNFTELNQIYLRGYLHNNVSNVREGLIRVGQGNYGFFATGPVARKEYLNLNNYKCMYDIDEIPIKYTESKIAFGLSKNSPYRKVINLGIIRMYESGLYKYMRNTINPNVIKCEHPKTYKTARLLDLSAAFGLLLIGHVFGIIVMTLEYLWKQRAKLILFLKKKTSSGNRIHHQLPFTN